MSNWCDNYITVECDNWDDIKRYCRDLNYDDEFSDFSFNKILPLEGGDASNVWGTKWDACDAYVGESFFNFQTAWGPSVPVTVALSLQFPDAVFTHAYNEPGCQFAGVVTIANGGQTFEEVFDPSNRNEYIKDLITAGLESEDNFFLVGEDYLEECNVDSLDNGYFIYDKGSLNSDSPVSDFYIFKDDTRVKVREFKDDIATISEGNVISELKLDI